MLVFTSITCSYIPKARVLARSLKAVHPDWRMVVVLCDEPPAGFDAATEQFDEIVTIAELGIADWRAWMFGHSVVELCTAVKGVAALVLADRRQSDKVLYLDPDIRVFHSLQPIADLLDRHAIVLTPHLADAETTAQAVVDNEICALQHGVFNLGFFAARTDGEGRRFLRWWADRLHEYCIDDIPRGLFTDQRWCDLAPGLFDGLHVLRDRGCNVATWNIHHRPLTRAADGAILAGGVKLRFYHFTGYDAGDGMAMLQRYAAGQDVALALWQDYAAALVDAGQGRPEFEGWRYGRFDNGAPIPLAARRLYRERADLQAAFPDPFQVGPSCFCSWWHTEGLPYHEADRPQAARAAHPAPRRTLPRLARAAARRLRRLVPPGGIA